MPIEDTWNGKTLEELQKIAMEKYEVLYNIRIQWDKYRYDRGVHYNKIIQEELTQKFGTTLSDAQKEYDEADQNRVSAFNDKREQESLSKIPYPEGTILVEWKCLQRHNYGYRNVDLTEGNRGIFQIFRTGDKIPENQRWGIPAHGDYIIRLLKDNGKPGTRIVRFDNRCWFPVGVNPNNVKEEDKKDETLNHLV